MLALGTRELAWSAYTATTHRDLCKPSKTLETMIIAAPARPVALSPSTTCLTDSPAVWLYEQLLSTCLQLLPSDNDTPLLNISVSSSCLASNSLFYLVAHKLNYQLTMALTGGLLLPAMQVQG